MNRRNDQYWYSLLKEDIKRLNQHLPRHRKPLAELLHMEEPKVEAIDGTPIIMKKEELEDLSKIIPEKYHNQLTLPIVIVRRIDLGRGTFEILGGKIETFAVRQTLNLTDLTFDQLDRNSEFHYHYIYRPQVQELLRKFKSLIVIGFGIPEGLKF